MCITSRILNSLEAFLGKLCHNTALLEIKDGDLFEKQAYILILSFQNAGKYSIEANDESFSPVTCK